MDNTDVAAGHVDRRPALVPLPIYLPPRATTTSTLNTPHKRYKLDAKNTVIEIIGHSQIQKTEKVKNTVCPALVMNEPRNLARGSSAWRRKIPHIAGHARPTSQR